jgi:mRNA-degrading endonuclease HigB of HigAB toxin-antitoxin module
MNIQRISRGALLSCIFNFAPVPFFISPYKRYTNHLQVRQDFPTADFIGHRRAISNICGNAYRLVVDLRYDLGRVYVRHIVTHAAYTRLMRRGGL